MAICFLLVQELFVLLLMTTQKGVADPSSASPLVLQPSQTLWRSPSTAMPTTSPLQQTPANSPTQQLPKPPLLEPLPTLPPLLEPLPTLPPLPPLPTKIPQVSSVQTSNSPFPQPTPTSSDQREIISRWLDLSRFEENVKKYILKLFPNKLTYYSCEGRCGRVEERKLPAQEKWWLMTTYKPPRCFCDKQCLLLGDCCYDFKDRCSHLNLNTSGVKSRSPTCKFQVKHAKYVGYILINYCPLTPHRSETSKLCSQAHQFNRADVLTSLPVLDLTTNASYGNVFCAACNERKKLAMWSFEASCNSTLPKNTPELELIQFAAKKCAMEFFPPVNSPARQLRICVPRLHNRNYASINDSSDAQKLKELCDSYAFPVCAITPDGFPHRFKNPHCLLLQGVFDMGKANVNIDCAISDPLPPPLTILFDFRSTSSYVISSKLKNEQNSKRLYEGKFKCKTDHIFDAFAGKCRRIFGKEKNCDLVKLEKSEFTTFENGCLWFRGTVYSNQSYYKINGSVFVCANLTQNYTVLESRYNQRKTIDVLTALTLFGCALSLVSLLLLIISYLVLPDLRNLPGKIVLSIALSMFGYLMLFFFINRNEHATVCRAIAVCLHYFFLSMFFWTNVMAFDIHGTFTRKGNVDFSRRSAGCCRGLYLKYALYAWLMPLLIVAVSTALDISRAYKIYFASQEDQYCFINNQHAKLYALVLPAGFILLYNCIALCHTVIHIKKIRKQTSTVANQSQQPGLPVVCIKMISVIGISWVLGYFAAFKVTAFLWYPYVVFNSLQGFLIFVSYVMNRRVLKMYRATFQEIRGKSNSVVSKKSTNVSPNL